MRRRFSRVPVGSRLLRVSPILTGHGSCGPVGRHNQGSIQVEAAIAPLPAQRIVPVRRSNPGSPKAPKSQDVLAGFAASCVRRHSTGRAL